MEDEWAFVVGLDLGSIARYASKDLGWERVSVNQWVDHTGCMVRYAYNAEAFCGHRAFRVYLIDGYDERDDWHEIDDMIRERGLDRHYL